jgi:hypothetical protein
VRLVSLRLAVLIPSKCRKDAFLDYAFSNFRIVLSYVYASFSG